MGNGCLKAAILVLHVIQRRYFKIICKFLCNYISRFNVGTQNQALLLLSPNKFALPSCSLYEVCPTLAFAVMPAYSPTLTS